MEKREVEAETRELERVGLLHRRAIKAANFTIQITPSSRIPFTLRSRNVSLHRAAPHQMNNSQSGAQEVLARVEEAALASPPAVAEEHEIFDGPLGFTKI